MDGISDELLQKAAAGDIGAFEQIYRAYAPFVYNVAYRMVEVKEDAEEITQEVFLTVHKKLNTFMFRSSLKTWVYRITANTALNLLDKRKRANKGRVDIDDVLPVTEGPDATRQMIEREDNEHHINALLNVLNAQERACIVLRNMQSLSYEDISKTLNINLNTVRTRLKRAREKMLKVREAKPYGL